MLVAVWGVGVGGLDLGDAAGAGGEAVVSLGICHVILVAGSGEG